MNRFLSIAAVMLPLSVLAAPATKPALGYLAISPDSLQDDCHIWWGARPLFFGQGADENREFFSVLLGFHMDEADTAVAVAEAGLSSIYATDGRPQAMGVLSLQFKNETDLQLVSKPLRRRYVASPFHDVTVRGTVVVLTYYLPGSVPRECYEAFRLAVIEALTAAA